MMRSSEIVNIPHYGFCQKRLVEKKQLPKELFVKAIETSSGKYEILIPLSKLGWERHRIKDKIIHSEYEWLTIKDRTVFRRRVKERTSRNAEV